jgi:hypothetical protein
MYMGILVTGIARVAAIDAIDAPGSLPLLYLALHSGRTAWLGIQLVNPITRGQSGGAPESVRFHASSNWRTDFGRRSARDSLTSSQRTTGESSNVARNGTDYAFHNVARRAALGAQTERIGITHP